MCDNTSYAQLSSYNKGMNGMAPPLMSGTVSGKMVVPQYSSPGYNILTHGNTGGSSYPTVMGAYGQNSGQCMQKYVVKKCN